MNTNIFDSMSGGGRPMGTHRHGVASGGGGSMGSQRHGVASGGGGPMGPQRHGVASGGGGTSFISAQSPFENFNEYFMSLDKNHKIKFIQSFCNDPTASGNNVGVYFNIVENMLNGFREFAQGDPELVKLIDVLICSIKIEHFLNISINISFGETIDLIKSLENGQGVPMLGTCNSGNGSHAIQYLFQRDGHALTISLINTGYGVTARSDTHGTCHSYKINSFFNEAEFPESSLRRCLQTIRNIGFQDSNGGYAHGNLEQQFKTQMRTIFPNYLYCIQEDQIQILLQRGGSCVFSSWNSAIDQIFGLEVANTLRLGIIDQVSMLLENVDSDLDDYSKDQMRQILGNAQKTFELNHRNDLYYRLNHYSNLSDRSAQSPNDMSVETNQNNDLTNNQAYLLLGNLLPNDNESLQNPIQDNDVFIEAVNNFSNRIIVNNDQDA